MKHDMNIVEILTLINGTVTMAKQLDNKHIIAICRTAIIITGLACSGEIINAISYLIQSIH